MPASHHPLSATMTVSASSASDAQARFLDALDRARDIELIDAEVLSTRAQPAADGRHDVTVTMTVMADSPSRGRELLLDAMDHARDAELIDVADVLVDLPA